MQRLYGKSVLIEPGSIAIQYTWAVPCNIKGSRSYYTISFYCLPLEGADGYELQISTAENFAKNKTKTFNVKKDGKLGSADVSPTTFQICCITGFVLTNLWDRQNFTDNGHTTASILGVYLTKCNNNGG